MSLVPFWNCRMTGAHNGIQSASDAIARGDYDWADLTLDSVEKGLAKAREETLNEMAQRDAGKSRGDDADVENGCNW